MGKSISLAEQMRVAYGERRQVPSTEKSQAEQKTEAQPKTQAQVNAEKRDALQHERAVVYGNISILVTKLSKQNIDTSERSIEQMVNALKKASKMSQTPFGIDNPQKQIAAAMIPHQVKENAYDIMQLYRYRESLSSIDTQLKDLQDTSFDKETS